MSVQVTSRTFAELYSSIDEAERLSALEHPTQQQRTRTNVLLAKISLLKQGVNPEELRRAEEDRLLTSAGYSRRPEAPRTALGAEIEREWRDFLLGGEVPKNRRPSAAEVRANEAGSQSITYTEELPGGAFVPQGIYSRAFATMAQYDQVFEPWASNVIETETGGTLQCPSWDDASNESVQVGETVQSTEVDVANFGQLQLAAYAFRSKVLGLSIELLQDSAFPFGQVLERVFAMRHARGFGKAMITGSGVNAPSGLLTAVVASGAVPVIATGSAANDGSSNTGANSIGSADLEALYSGLNPAYRPGAVFYMNDSTRKFIGSIIDKMGRPLVSIRKGLGDGGDGDDEYVLLGKRVAICPSMPNIGSAANSIVFGNPAYFLQRRVPSSMYVRAFRENPTLVQYGLVGFESWLRGDCNLVAPNQNALPYNYIQCHS